MVSIADVMEYLTKSIGPIPNTVDTLKSGDAKAQVKGIGTAFMPSYPVLREAVESGLNLVIVHEAPFYHHRDEVDLWKDDPVYQAKKTFIEESGLAIFRLHDYMHRCNPDLIVEGLIRDLDWVDYVTEPQVSGLLPLRTSPLSIPAMTVQEVADHVKRKLGVPFVRVVGNLSMPCSRVAILPGYTGGGSLAIPFFEREALDLIIAGEGPEWETPEYVKDAAALGHQKALIVLGHQKSEESGMKYLATSLRAVFPGVPVEFIAEEQPFHVV